MQKGRPVLLEWLVPAAWRSQGLTSDPNERGVELGARENRFWGSGSWAGARSPVSEALGQPAKASV